MAAELAHSGHVERRVRQLRADTVTARDDSIAEETAIALMFNCAPHAVMMASPLDLEDFALGFSLTEGIIQQREELLSTRVRMLARGAQISVTIPPERMAALGQRSRALEGFSGCGICGTKHIEQVMRTPRTVTAAVTVDPPAIARALAQLARRQQINALTGAVHAAAWAHPDGEIAHLREDVGRHNALDKLIGALARADVQASSGFLVLTSRASYELVLKAASANLAMMVAISAPTSLAIELAEQAGITLIGFARGDRCTVYTRPERLSGIAIHERCATP
jgi:FdhD protein